MEAGRDAGQAADLDVREVPKPQRHPMIFERFAGLAPGESFVLVNTHEPIHLHEEFERDQPGAYDWECHQAGPRNWRVRITRRTSPLPQVLCDAAALAGPPRPGQPLGAVWHLEMAQRQLDANVVRLAPGEHVSAHAEPRLDVLLLVLGGGGSLQTEAGPLELRPMVVVWLPLRARRELQAGPEGLTYLTVHTRRPGLSIETAAPSVAAHA